MPITGIHHITLCAGGAQEDVDFITKVLGKLLIKQTVLFDGRYAHYHLYPNANAEIGSVLTTPSGRPWPRRIARSRRRRSRPCKARRRSGDHLNTRSSTLGFRAVRPALHCFRHPAACLEVIEDARHANRLDDGPDQPGRRCADSTDRPLGAAHRRAGALLRRCADSARLVPTVRITASRCTRAAPRKR